jgi:homoserine dehydrogenase
LCLLGFGNVNRALVRLLVDRESELRERGVEWRITGVASRRLGWIADAGGIEPGLLSRDEALVSGDFPEASRRSGNVGEWLATARADVLLEATSLNVENGQPAVDHLRTALEHGAHAITANKGPVVYAHRELCELAAARGKRFLF